MIANSFLQSMTDDQLIRLWNRILTRIHEWASGGSMFGVDERTLYQCKPGLHRAFVVVRAEGRRRRI